MIANHMYPIALTVVLGFLVVGCDANAPQAASSSAQTAPKAAAAKPAVLTAGGTAYVRVKRYSAPSGDPTMRDSLGGTGFVLENLNPAGIEAPVARTGSEPAFQFAEPVTLVEKKDGPPALWLVSKGQTQAWVPTYILTANKAEIDFLKANNRIPESMAFIFSEDLKIWGVFSNGNFVIHSQGLALMDYPEGTSPVAIKGGAVMFDESAAKHKWTKPLVFTAKKAALSLSPTQLYYCVSAGNSPAFESIDLVTLQVRR